MAGLYYNINKNTNRILHLAISLAFITFLYIQTALADSVNAATHSVVLQDILADEIDNNSINLSFDYDNDNNDNINHQEFTEVFEFCDNNHQASDLCYLLAEDVLDYQNLKDDPSFNDHFTDYAQSIGVVSLPMFLRYLPALANLAKNNMLVFNTVFLISGAIVFKKYYDYYFQTSMIKVKDFDRSSTLASKSIKELKSSKIYQYYLNKGADHEKNVLVPFLLERKKGVSSHKSLEKDFQKLEKKAIEHKESKALIAYNKAIISSVGSAYFNAIIIRDFYFNRDKVKFYNDYWDSEFLRVKKPQMDSYKPNIYQTGWTSSISQWEDLVLLGWETLLLEHISHLELLDNNKSPAFEESIYIPFVKNQIKSLDAQKNKAITYLQYLETLTKDDPDYQYKSNKQYLKIFTPISSSSSSLSSSQKPLLPSNYLEYDDYIAWLDNLDDLEDYFSTRKDLLTQILTTVEDRINVWNRAANYQFLPGEPRSDQALKQWNELFNLATPDFDISDLFYFL